MNKSTCRFLEVSSLGEGQAHDFKSVSNDADSHELLAVVAPIHHKGVGEALDDGAIGLAKALDGIAASGVGDVDRGADLDIIAVGDLVSQSPCQSTQKATVAEKSIQAQRPLLSTHASLRC